MLAGGRNNNSATFLTDILTKVAASTTTSTTTTSTRVMDEKMTILKALIGQNRTIMQLRQRILSRLLFPDFDLGGGGGGVDSTSLDYKLGQEYEETSRFLDSLSGSGGSSNKTVLFTNDDYSSSSVDYESSMASQLSLLNETAASSPGSDYGDGYFLAQMSTPFMYILFMFIVYILIITVIFMSAVYSHRKRVGYNYDADEEELIGGSDKTSPRGDNDDEINYNEEQQVIDEYHHHDDSDSDYHDPTPRQSGRSRKRRLSNTPNNNNNNQESSHNLAYSGDSSSDDTECSSSIESPPLKSIEDQKATQLKINRAKNVSYLENMFKLLADVNIDELKRSIRSNKLLNHHRRQRGQSKNNKRAAIVKESDKSLDQDEQDVTCENSLFHRDDNIDDEIQQSSSCAVIMETSEPLLKKRNENGP